MLYFVLVLRFKASNAPEKLSDSGIAWKNYRTHGDNLPDDSTTALKKPHLWRNDGMSEMIDLFDELRVVYSVALVSSPLLRVPLALLTLPNLYSQSVLKHPSVPDIHGSL